MLKANDTILSEAQSKAANNFVLVLQYCIKVGYCCDQDVKIVPSASFTKRTCDRWGSFVAKRGGCHRRIQGGL